MTALFILGYSSYTLASGSITSDGQIYIPSSAEGTGFFSLVGFRLGIHEFLGGIRKDDVTFKGLKTSSGSTLSTDQQVAADTMVFGMGLVF